MTDGRIERAEQRSLAMHSLIAERIRSDAGIIDQARARVDQWLRDGSIAHPLATAWREALEGDAERIAERIVATDAASRRLRKTSPFAGVLDARTRWEVWRRFRSA